MTPAETLRREQAKAERERLELHLLRDLRAVGLHPERQFVIPDGGREFLYDFRLGRILIEVQGGIWSNGAHARGSGIERDTEKACYAASHGYYLMPVTGGQIVAGLAVRWIEAALRNKT